MTEFGDKVRQHLNSSLLAQVEQYQDILHSTWLHGNWYRLTKPLTTVEKEAFANAVEAASARLMTPDDGVEVERWWRPDYSPINRLAQRIAAKAAAAGMTPEAYFDSLITPEQVQQVARGVIEGCA